MRAVLRLTIAMFAGGLWLGPSFALAQNAAQPTTNTPATDTIGPRELQGFSLNGTVTKQADTPPPKASTRPQERASSSTAPTTTQPRETPRTANPRQLPAPRSAPGANPGQSLTADLPPPGAVAVPAQGNAPEPGFSTDAASAPVTLAPEQKLSLWPWLLLAGVLGAGAAFLLWRRHSREAYAGGRELDGYAEPEPQSRRVPAPPVSPVPAPAPKLAAPPAGIVTTRLRPWVDIAFAPLGCVVDDEKISIEFDVQIVNSGSGPARDILIEASMFNASENQGRDVGAFFAKPAGEGERIEILRPLQSITVRSTLLALRANIQLFELAGRQVFVPIVAFNVLYRWGGGQGQTSASYLLGRDTRSDKLGPLRADLGPRAFTELAVRLLPTGLRK